MVAPVMRMRPVEIFSRFWLEISAPGLILVAKVSHDKYAKLYWFSGILRWLISPYLTLNSPCTVGKLCETMNLDGTRSTRGIVSLSGFSYHLGFFFFLPRRILHFTLPWSSLDHAIFHTVLFTQIHILILDQIANWQFFCWTLHQADIELHCVHPTT